MWCRHRECSCSVVVRRDLAVRFCVQLMLKVCQASPACSNTMQLLSQLQLLFYLVVVNLVLRAASNSSMYTLTLHNLHVYSIVCVCNNSEPCFPDK
jgi:hypothetical protein